jgi:tetratricopeptide (TPR) repeat protein
VAELQLLQPNIVDASNDFDQSIRLVKRNGLAHWYRAIIYLRRLSDAENTQKAVAEFDEAIANGVTDAIVYTDRGLAQEILGDSDAAMKDFDEALRKEPDLAMARWARMRAHYKLAQNQLALQDCEALQKLCENPSRKEVFATLSGESQGLFDSWPVIHTILLIRLQKYDEALAKLNQEIDSSKGFLKGQKLYLRGLVYAGQGRKDLASADFQRAEQSGYNASNFSKQN